MSARLTRRDRTLLLTTGAIALVVIVLIAVVGGDSTESAVPTTYSPNSGGAKAAYLLLRESGYSVARWERSPTDLQGASATVIFAEPESAPTASERAAVADFLQRGGRVIATGASTALFLPDGRIVPDLRVAVSFARVKARTPSPITRAAPEISLSPAAHWDGDSSAVVLYADDKRRVVKYSVGRGEVIWWASSTPITNAGITERGNLEFFLACLGDRRRPILWDEYYHGHRGIANGPIAASPFRLIAVPLGVALVAVLLTYSRRSGPIVPLEQENRLSPLEFVRTLGMLYQNAGAGSVAVDVACSRFRYRLARRLGVASMSPINDLERAARARFRLNDSRLGDLLRECESVRLDRRLSAARALQLTQALADQSAELGLQ